MSPWIPAFAGMKDQVERARERRFIRIGDQWRLATTPIHPDLHAPMDVENVIHIDASPEVVWGVTENVERWPEWTPTMTSVRRVDEGPFGLGSRARIKQPRQVEAEWVVTEFDAPRRFAWRTRRAGLRMTGSHEITPEGEGTRNTLRIEVEGILGLLLWPLLRPAMRRALAQENRGLKAHCEQIAAILRARLHQRDTQAS